MKIYYAMKKELDGYSTKAKNLIINLSKSQSPLYPTSTIRMSPIKFSICKVSKPLLQLNTFKSSRHDGIPAIILKSYTPELAPVLNKLFQLSYNFSILLSSCKLVHIFPIPPKCNKSDPSNYCPITIIFLPQRWKPSLPNNC